MLDLAIHIRTGNLVAYKTAGPVLGDFRQGTTPVRIRIVDDNPQYPGGTGQQYQAADLTDYPQVRLGLWTRTAFAADTGSASGVNLAFADSSAIAPVLSYNDTDEDDPYFEGDWNLATTEIADLSGKTAAVYFTVNLVYTDGTSLFPLIDTEDGKPNARLLAATDDGFAASPGYTTGGTATINLPLNLHDPGTGRTWQWAYDATTDGPKLTEI